MFKSIQLLSLLFVASNCVTNDHFLLPKDLETGLNFTDCFPATNGENIFQFSVPNLNKSLPLIQFEEYRGKAIVVLNVATFCRSATDYPQLNKLKEKYGNDLEIVGFPCSQFWNVSQYQGIYF